MTNPADLSIPDAAARLRTGTLTSERLTQAHLERIARLDPEIHAFVAIDPDAAMAAAASADAAFEQGLDLGPLHGIPIAVKDLIDVAGLPTLCGSRLRSGHVATDDAEVVRRLRAAGAVPLGKLATYEFALVGPSFDGPSPPPLNPRSPGHITGGSSSGAAAAVAAGLLRTAIGTDTGGSLRSPAGYCGVVGLKPTFGRVSRRGVFPLSPSLDHVGPVAASVAEAALTFDAIADEGPKASARLGQDIAGLRIAYARNWFARDPELTPELLQAMDAAVGGLARLGALIDEVDLPDYAVMEAAGAVILHAEALAVHRATLAGTGAGYGRQAWQSLLSGLCLTPADLAAAHRAAACLRAAIELGGVRPPRRAGDGEHADARAAGRGLRGGYAGLDSDAHPALQPDRPSGAGRSRRSGRRPARRHADCRSLQRRSRHLPHRQSPWNRRRKRGVVNKPSDRFTPARGYSHPFPPR